MITKLIPMLFISAALIMTGCGKKTESQTNPGGDPGTPTSSETIPTSGDITFSFGEDEKVSQDGNSQVFKKSGITFTNKKASSTTPVAAYSPIRCYKNSQIVVEAEQGNISKITFTTVNYQDKGDGKQWAYSFKGTEALTAGTWDAPAAVSGQNTTSYINGINAASVTITLSACQIRISTMVVTLA